MNFLLVAVFSAGTGSFFNSDARGFQTSTMEKFDTLKQCKLAAAQLGETYTAGHIKASLPDRGQARCVNLETGEVTIVTSVP